MKRFGEVQESSFISSVGSETEGSATYVASRVGFELASVRFSQPRLEIGIVG